MPAPIRKVGFGRVTEALTMEIYVQTIRKFIKNSRGATAIEYGLIAALIAVAAIGAMKGMGTQLSSTFGNVQSQLSSSAT